MFGKKKQVDWFYIARKNYRKGYLERPYDALFRYYVGVTWDGARRFSHEYNDGHSVFFMLAQSDESLDYVVDSLQSVLPKNLLNNFNTALERYFELGEDPDWDDIETAFSELDGYVDENSEQIEDILKNYVLEMYERNILR